MEARAVFCPVCGRDVTIATTVAPRQGGGHATIPDEPRRVCLDFGEACDPPCGGGADSRDSRATCPVFHVPTVVMGVLRAKTGLTPEPRPLVTIFCEGCGAETSQERIGSAFAVCELCGSTNRLAPEPGRPA